MIIFKTLNIIFFQSKIKVRNYKRQIEEAEEIAALNLTKFRKAQVDLQESLERADLNEQALAKFRARGRSASVAREYWKLTNYDEQMIIILTDFNMYQWFVFCDTREILIKLKKLTLSILYQKYNNNSIIKVSKDVDYGNF